MTIFLEGLGVNHKSSLKTIRIADNNNSPDAERGANGL